jgi:uncharacterized protein Smg (DUF494 family)
MTDEQINIAIAESLGWESCGMASTGKMMGYKTEEWEQLPNYTADLNAMHEAEKVLTAEQRKSYINCIFNLPVSECESNAFATAAQRAEAFLRVIGKWEISDD